MEFETASKCLAELGNPHRLKAFRLLVQAGPEGLPCKEIQAHLGIPKSTLSHHIAHMVWAGIVTQTREGRILRCRLNYDHVRGVLDFLMDDCCRGLCEHENSAVERNARKNG
ncbi:MAG: transcriptional regulator [Rhodospirillaceae bacterium]|nr:transcriptional regulator [Rhodospirillaceae bacterium]HAA93901.1 transcriptional regulator [Rhodospirillaceae bacterium]|tara:strand:+ start:184 stop:519 length:336 start_codon:yes stop_codon:yes gene_type:complete